MPNPRPLNPVVRLEVHGDLLVEPGELVQEAQLVGCTIVEATRTTITLDGMPSERDSIWSLVAYLSGRTANNGHIRIRWASAKEGPT